MTTEEFNLYWRPARDTFGSFKGKVGNVDHPSYLLAKAVGVHYPRLAYWNEVVLTDDLKNILLALVSPYRDTLLKIYQIKKGLK